MSDPFYLADELGPARVVHVYEPGSGLRGTLVVDNVATGPSIGGLRIAPDVSTEECFRLARAMTLKNAAAGLPHGGGKAVIYGNPKMPLAEKERLVRTMASALRGIEDYIFGPDMGTNEQSMAWVRDEIGRSVGLPREVGGIPLDEIGATGWGVLHATRVALGEQSLRGLRVVVQGFGAVGKHAARFLAAEGAILVGAADSSGAVYDPAGIDVERLAQLKLDGGSVADWPAGEKLDTERAVEMDCDVLIPAARPDVIHGDNAAAVKAALIVQGANIPVTADAERSLHERGVLCVPDFIANAGGVICAAMEYHGATESAAMATIAEKVTGNTRLVLEAARTRGCLPREAALDLAEARVRRAMEFRRHGILSSAPGAI
jgi:glutamate dehydrogenase (NAD(P)+)